MEKYLAEQSSQVPVEAKKTDPMRMLMTRSVVNTVPASGCKWKAMESGSRAKSRARVRNDELGKIVRKHSEAFVKTDWWTFVTSVRGRGDVKPNMETLQGHNAKELLKYLGEMGAPVVLSTKPWELPNRHASWGTMVVRECEAKQNWCTSMCLETNKCHLNGSCMFYVVFTCLQEHHENLSLFFNLNLKRLHCFPNDKQQQVAQLAVPVQDVMTAKGLHTKLISQKSTRKIESGTLALPAPVITTAFFLKSHFQPQ